MTDLIEFTDFTLDPRDTLLMREVKGPFPPDWTRVVITQNTFNISAFKNWLLDSTNGRFGVLHYYPTTAVYFEDYEDAILCKLREGDQEWLASDYQI